MQAMPEGTRKAKEEDKGITMNVSEFIIDQLAQLGVRHIFTLAGGHAMYLQRAMTQHPKITPICCQHEQACVIAAEGYAKATGNVGVAVVTAGPGVTNAITGLAGAYLDRSPVLVISGAPRQGAKGWVNQEVPAIPLVQELTGMCRRVDRPGEARYWIEKACHWTQYATQHYYCPVSWLEIPLDVQEASMSEAEWELSPASPHPESEAYFLPFVPELSSHMQEARKPLLLIGNGARRQFPGIRQWCRDRNIPVAVTWLAMDFIGAHDPLFAGKPGNRALPDHNDAMAQCDLLIVCGARCDSALDPDELAPQARKIGLDARHVPLIECERKESWHRVPPFPSDPFCNLIQSLTTPGDEIVCASSGRAAENFFMNWKQREGQRVYHTAGLGAMGFALPTAVGVALAKPGRRVICLDGDGGLQLNVQELATLSNYNLPVKVIVMANGGYKSIQNTQKKYFGGEHLGCGPDTGLMLPNLKKMSEAYGLRYEKLELEDWLFSWCVTGDGPALCEVQLG